jgi:hypothetical protein
MILQRFSIFAAEFTDSDPGISKTSIIEMSWRHWEGMHEAPMNLCVFNMFQPVSWNLSTLKPHFEDLMTPVETKLSSAFFFCSPNKIEIGEILRMSWQHYFPILFQLLWGCPLYTWFMTFIYFHDNFSNWWWHTIDNNKWMIHEVIYINIWIIYIYITYILYHDS